MHLYTEAYMDAYQWLHCRVSNKLKCSGSGACGYKCCRIWIFQYPGGSGAFMDGNEDEALDYLLHHQQTF